MSSETTHLIPEILLLVTYITRLVAEIAFTTLLKRLPNLCLADPDAALEWRPAFELRGLSSLPVVF